MEFVMDALILSVKFCTFLGENEALNIRSLSWGNLGEFIFFFGRTVIFTKLEVIQSKFLGKIFTENVCPCKMCAKIHVCTLGMSMRYT